MTNKSLYIIWAVLFAICAALGFLVEPEGLDKGICVVMSLLFFVPPGAIVYLSWKKKAWESVRLVRNLALGSLALTGIPPFIGFTSKWMLFESAWQMGGTFGYLGVAALLISALLTAIYLLVPSFHACFAKPNHGDEITSSDPGLQMRVPFTVWACAIVVLTFASQPLIRFIMTCAGLQ